MPKKYRISLHSANFHPKIHFPMAVPMQISMGLKSEPESQCHMTCALGSSCPTGHVSDPEASLEFDRTEPAWVSNLVLTSSPRGKYESGFQLRGTDVAITISC